MARATRVLAVTTVVATAAALWFYVDDRALRGQLAERPPAPIADTPAQIVSRAADPWTAPARASRGAPPHGHGPLPALPDVKPETRLERRQRRQAELAAMFGRQDGETDDEYRARIVPLIKTGLAIPRARLEDQRRAAEQLAHVTAEQSKKLDATFDKAYDNLLDYTNKAISDGVLSPYERNVSGWLEYAGGLGTMLGEVDGQIGQVLSPDQVKTLGASGFEWGEYLGLEAPWENLSPPPPPKH